MEEQVDVTTLKYVLYARKSTTDEARQVRSIGDQISDCLELARRLKLNIVGKPITETQSAKKPRQRPAFTEMLEIIKSGKADAILTWDPDRLARNMLEAGEVIDLVDTGIIKDLKFVTHHFTNNASGKMLLGISFAISKQYSDALSEKVGRGVQHSFEEGKSPAPKHGYVRTEEGTYQPDYATFDLIKTAWQMRKSGDSLESITEYLNDNGYKRIVKSSGREIVMTKQTLSNLFQDPFYYGKLIQANQSVYLPSLYEFQPAVSESEFFAIQIMTNGRKKMKPTSPHKNAFYPLRLMVKCAYCDKFCFVAPSSGTTKKYLYLRCDTKGCPRKKRSLRSKVVFDFITELLKDGLNFTEKEYQEYLSNLTTLSDEKKTGIRLKINNAQGTLNHVIHKKKTLSLGLANIPSSHPAYQVTLDEVSTLKEKELQLNKELRRYKNQLEESEQDNLTIEEFLNLSKNAHIIVKSADSVIKDEIIRTIFLNFSIDEEKVTMYTLKEPFATLLKHRLVKNGRGDWTRTSETSASRTQRSSQLSYTP